MNIQAALNKVIDGYDLSNLEMRSVMHEIMQGDCTNAQIGGFLIALRMKGETVEEIAGAAHVMRELATKVHLDLDNLVDIVGTGGDSSNTFNISTTAAFVVAAAGGNVAKHNNRSVSSKSGSADVLEAAGVKLDLTPGQIAECVNQIGVGFMFAPMHHKATRHAASPRKELGTRTIFNILGPLTNPSGVANQLIGVYSGDWLLPLAEVLNKLGSRHVMVVHSDDRMDEISISAPSNIVELKDGEISSYQINPEEFNLEYGNRDDITVSNVDESLQLMTDVLANKPGPARNIVIMNAAAAIYLSGVCKDMKAGITMAEDVLNDGLARNKLADLIAFTNDFN